MSSSFSVKFRRWMSNRPHLYRMLNNIDGGMNNCDMSAVLKTRFLVLDHFGELGKPEAHFDILGTGGPGALSGVGNFRKIEGASLISVTRTHVYHLPRDPPAFLLPSHAGFPVFGMAQPTRKGLNNVMKFLTSGKDHSFKRIVSYNLREEPVVVVGDVSYSPRLPWMLTENLSMVGVSYKMLERIEQRLVDAIAEEAEKGDGLYGVSRWSLTYLSQGC